MPNANNFEIGTRVYTTTDRSATIGQQPPHISVVNLPKGAVGEVVGSYDSYRCMVMFLLNVGVSVVETAPDGKNVESGDMTTMSVTDLIPEEYLIKIK